MGAVDTTYTFTATDTITSTKMNNIIDQTTITNDAIWLNDGLEVASGKIRITGGGITSSKLGAGSVTTNAVADGAVTSAKLSTGGPVWTSSTGTITIPQSQLELGTGNQTSTASLIDFHSVYPSTDYEARIIRYAGTNGGMVIEQTGSGGMSLTSPSGFAFNSAPMPAPVGTAPIFGVRAWANINGTVGSVSVRQGGNVSGVVRNQLGRYTITFTTPMPDTNYAIVAWARDANATDNNYFVSAASNATKLAGSFQIEVNSPGGAVDSPEINIMVIR